MAIAIFSIFFISLFLTGYLIFQIFAPLRNLNLSWKTLFIALNIGMSLCHGLVVSQVPLDFVFKILIALAVISLFAMYFKKPKCDFGIQNRKWELLFIFIMVFPFFFFAISEPLTAWDARSIWFFRGKLLFFGNGLHYLPYNLASLNFMARDYPLFMPALTATLMTPIHWWNEYFPKIILWIWMAQVIFAFSDLCRRPLVIMVWVSIYFYFCGEYMWNGYMDAYVAFFSLFGLTYLYYFIEYQNEFDLFAGISSFIVSAQIKNEGVVLSLVIFLLFFLWILLKYIRVRINWIRYGTFTALLSAPIFIYGFTKKSWNVGNYLKEGFNWERTLHRATNLNDLIILFKGLLMPDRFLYTLGFLLFAFIYSLMTKKRFSWLGSRLAEVSLVVLVASAYMLVLLTVFLITPLDLKDHVAYADRVSFPIYFFMIFIALWLLARPVEDKTP